MSRRPAISSIIEDIFEAGLDPARWNDVVVGINNYVGGFACGLFSKNPISKFGITHYFCGADPHYIKTYSETCSKFDPLAALPRAGQVVGIPDLVNYQEYRAGRFYQEWLSPQGCVDAANVVLDDSSASFPVLLTVLSGKRMVDRDMRRRLAQIVPYAHRALRINRAIDARQSEACAFEQALNGLSAAVFFVDARCRLIHANASGEDLLLADDALRLLGGRFTIRDPQQHQALRRRFAANDDSLLRMDNDPLPLITDNGERFLLYILPVKSVTRLEPEATGKAVAALFVQKTALDSKLCANLIAATFQLTPAESRVLLAIVQSGGVPETAKLLGVAETTVKTHLHRIFSKTGASRQTDLVRLTAGYASPLAS